MGRKGVSFNNQERLVHDLAWWAMVVTGLVTAFISGMCFGDDSDYYQAKAKAALALHNTAIPQKDQHQHVELSQCLKPLTMYTATWCAVCPEVKQKLGLDPKHPVTTDHDFVITVADMTDKEAPNWISSYPFFSFELPNGQIRYMPWEGLEKLKARYQKTFETTPVPPKAKAGSPYPSFKGYNPRWTWPGDLRTHLRYVHGIGESFSLSQDQAEALHDALHEGHSASKIRNYYRKKG